MILTGRSYEKSTRGLASGGYRSRLKKKGTSLAAESRKAGLSSSTLANTLTRPWPKGELIIADVLGIKPWVIWPSRYHDAITDEFIDRTHHIRNRAPVTPVNSPALAIEHTESQ